jgi:leader peptidase (prepilin peptidase)/N-methyltransferase
MNRRTSAFAVSLKLSKRQALVALAISGVLAFSGLVWGPASSGLAGLILALALAWAAMVDADRFILPDLLTLGLTVVGLSLAAAESLSALLHHAIGAAAGFFALAGVALAYRRLRGMEGLGRGDTKLMAAAGAWLGWAGLPSVLLAASLGGLAWAAMHAVLTRHFSSSRAIAFGPFIAAGIWIVWLVGPFGGYPYPTFAD